MRTRDHILAARENVRFAARALTAYKLRSALTVLGIVIGVTTVIAMVSIIEGFNNSVIHDFQSFGATLVTPSLVVSGLMVAVITGVAAGFFPARRAANLPPIDALRAD